MNTKQIIKYALSHALGAALYIALVVLFMGNAQNIFGKEPDGSFFPSMVFLLLFVTSAAVMGLTIFARPIMWYLDGLKKEAVKLSIWTVGFLAGIAIIVALLFIAL